MKIAICGDVHWSQNSSIIKGRGDLYSIRLENLIKSVNWFERTAWQNDCQRAVYLGDFFDRAYLNAEEITALNEIKWVDLPHYFLVGNHESNAADLYFNSTNIFNFVPDIQIINDPRFGSYHFDREVLFLPYILEGDRKPLKEYIVNKNEPAPIIFSHNDIKGIKYGQVESREGFNLKEIEENCPLFINGHIHNGSYLNKNGTILNLGNLTGQNFSEDAFKYKHCIAILNTDDLHLDFIENPYALNFYKVDLSNDNYNISSLPNAVITIRCRESEVKEVREKIKYCSNIVESRIISIPDIKKSTVEISELAYLDHIEQFRNYIIEKLGNSELIESELMEIIK